MITETTEIVELQQLAVFDNDIIREALARADMEINDRQDAEQSEIVKNIIKTNLKNIEETRKQLWQPYYDTKKAIDARAKELMAPLEAAEKSLNRKQIAYNDKVEAEKKQQQEEMNKLAEETGWFEEAEIENETIEREADRQKVQRGINYNKKIIKVDWDALPRQYRNIKDMEITPKVAEIKKAMQLGLRVDWIVFEE